MTETVSPPGPILVLAGTRPEGIKIAPLVRRWRHEHHRPVRLVDSGQHPDRVGAALLPFDLAPDVVVPPGPAGHTLAELAARLLTDLDAVVVAHRPAAVVVQGDTLTALSGALVAFWRRVPVVHLEAGLRTYDLGQPFPEEASRAMLARVAALHLAPTALARDRLLAEGIPATAVVVTGNTVVDALRLLVADGRAEPPQWMDTTRPTVVVTAHRRENWGDGIAGVCAGLRRLAERRTDVQIVMVAPPNPAIAATLTPMLGDLPAVRITPPLPYPTMIGLLRAADVVVTDSGGLQEEAATLGTPLLVTRSTTERPEAGGTLVGTDPDRIATVTAGLLGRPRPSIVDSPFGDGHAADRCVAAIGQLLGADADARTPTGATAGGWAVPAPSPA